MKTKQTNRRHTRRGLQGYIPLCALAAMVLCCCSKDAGDGQDDGLVPVEFTACIATAGPAADTRTTNGGNDWAAGDKVGIYMLRSAGTLAGGDIYTIGGLPTVNRQYLVNENSGALTPAAWERIFYPQAPHAADFIAYHPYTGQITPDYKYNVTLTGATDLEELNALDVLYAKKTGVNKSSSAVPIYFGHALSKITLRVTAGNGVSASDVQNMAAADIVFKGMPLTASMDLQDGSLTAGPAGDFNPVKGTVTGIEDASFTALLVPQPQDNGATSAGLPDLTGRTVVFSVGGLDLVWEITDNIPFLPGNHNLVFITLSRTGVQAGNVSIDPWNPNPTTDGNGEARQIMPEANSYMVAPGSEPILIPVSQANRIYGPDGLGASTDGLNRVDDRNFSVELVWGDTPIGTPGCVIKEAVADGGCIKVTPGDTPGNAVIGIKLNGETTYRWSWHIWVTEPVTSATDTKTGLTWMDRNLGATANTPRRSGTFNNDQWVKTLGLYYQWGRKDAFPGSDGTNNTRQYYTHSGGTTPTNANLIGDYTELPDMVRNPLSVASNATSYYGSVNDVSENNDSWGGETNRKTVYDPCPPGWRVPPTTVNGGNTWGDDNNSGWLSLADKGHMFNGVNGTAGLGHYYPAAGNRYSSYRSNTGINGYYWSSSAYSTSLGWYLYFYQSNVTQNYVDRYYAFSVRCVAEPGSP